MIGAIIGDVIGSAYEWNNVKSKEFPLFSYSTDFTDDTVMTITLPIGLRMLIMSSILALVMGLS